MCLLVIKIKVYIYKDNICEIAFSKPLYKIIVVR